MNADEIAELEGARLAVSLLSSLTFAATRGQRAEILLTTVWELQSAAHGDAIAVGFARTLATGLEIAMADNIDVRGGPPGSLIFCVSGQRETAVRKNASQAVRSLKKGRKRDGR